MQTCYSRLKMMHKLYLIILLYLFHQAGAQDEEAETPFEQLENLILTTAKYGAPCSKELDSQYVSQIYSSDSEDNMWKAKVALNDHIGSHPELANASCYGLVPHPHPEIEPLMETFMTCATCPNRYKPQENFDCCQCVNQEPFVYEKLPNRECSIKESLLGDPCDPLIAAKYKIKIQQVLHMELKDSKKRMDYVHAMTKYVLHAESFLPYDALYGRRLLCTTESRNMECSDGESTCKCISDPPYFKYEPSKDGTYCVGTEGAICHLLYVVDKGSFEQVSICAEGLKCEEAVPGLFCNDPLEDGCNIQIPSEEEDNLTMKLLLWNIRACGGEWKDRQHIERSLSACLTFQLATILLSLTNALTCIVFSILKALN